MPTHAQTLIARVRELGHTDAEIARRLGISRSQIAHVASGRDKLSPELAALLADLVGEDAQAAMARQSIDNATEPRRSMLERALFTLGVLGVSFASLTTPTATADEMTGAGQIINRCPTLLGFHPIYIVGHLADWLRRRWAPRPPRSRAPQFARPFVGIRLRLTLLRACLT